MWRRAGPGLCLYGGGGGWQRLLRPPPERTPIERPRGLTFPARKHVHGWVSGAGFRARVKSYNPGKGVAPPLEVASAAVGTAEV